MGLRVNRTVEVDAVSASHLLGGSGKSARAYQGAFVRAHILDQSEERFNAGNVDRPCVILAVEDDQHFVRLGIHIERIKPGNPQQNGSHERMHLTLKKEATRPAGRNFLQQQARFDRFIQCFNFERPPQRST
jgi:transposase InsO family protein